VKSTKKFVEGIIGIVETIKTKISNRNYVVHTNSFLRVCGMPIRWNGYQSSVGQSIVIACAAMAQAWAVAPIAEFNAKR
jgi:hypothetical protein